eukprot:SAG31_NODE_2431_length_5707_cov_2.157810_2_plen_225_part_00
MPCGSFSKVVLAAREWAEEAALPFLITEYNAAYFGHDTAYAAAFLFHNIPLLIDVDILSYWTFSDIFEEGWLAGPPFQDTWGAITKEGIRKPAWRAFQLLNLAGDQILNVSVTPSAACCEGAGNAAPLTTAVSAFATIGSSSNTSAVASLQIFVSNFWPKSGATAAPRTPVHTNLSLRITGMDWAREHAMVHEKLPATAQKVFLFRIDDNVTDPAMQWFQCVVP